MGTFKNIFDLCALKLFLTNTFLIIFQPCHQSIAFPDLEKEFN